MVIKVTPVQVQGLKQLDQALQNLADEKGEKWKRAAMVDAAKKALRPAMIKAKSNAPYRTGRLRRGLISNPKYRYPSKAQVRSATRQGMTRKSWRHELTAPITLRPSWNTSRYPFIIEAGITKRRAHKRKQAFGKPTKPYFVETPLREPVLYMHKALGSAKSQVVDVFKRTLATNVRILANTEYKTARTALRKRR